ncbi:polynucleotide 5'-hydroxyl-kinase NOL9 [Bicyclus anynana]|uniref:Polynucleotide 5'-hydroxyl-kinase NOL9 n=1 Tax=Bicyclus anynana TaxID=110368 RepID=A0A6J1P6Q8_BICAN|nr:polynucleotide 5'-hydroxyl-kinase NOL9 [Bicyclus anynana]
MEFFERAHGIRNTSSKDRKSNESKKMQLKQMLFGYKAKDNKLIQRSTELQNDYEDSISVSGYSDLNITNSSYENENDALIINEKSTKCDNVMVSSDTDDKASENSYKINELSDNKSFQPVVRSDIESNDKVSEELYDDESVQSVISTDHESNERDDIVSDESNDYEQEDSSHLDSELSNDFDMNEYVDNSDLEITDSETSIVISGLKLSDSDNSEFDADRQLAHKIQEKLQIKSKTQQNKNKYSIELEDNDIPKGPVTKERCFNLQTQELLSGNDKDLTTQLKNNKRKRKDTTALKENDVAKGPISKEKCIKIQEEQKLPVSREELMQKRMNKRKHKEKYTIELDEKQRHKHKYNIILEDANCAGPVNIESISEDENAQFPISKIDLSTHHSELSSDELIEEEFDEDKLNYEETNDGNQSDDIDMVMSPAYVSITASDMPIQRLDDIIGEYKYSTIRNLPSEISNIISTDNSGFFIDENTNAVVEMVDDDVSSLIPELDDTPKLKEVDEGTAKETTNKTFMTSASAESEISDKEESISNVNVSDTFKVYYGTEGCIITLRHPAELYVQGKVKITSLAGTNEIFGYKLDKKCYEIFAPYYNFAQCIKTIESDNNYFGLFSKLTALGLTVAEAEDIVTNVGEYNGVLLLQKLSCNPIDFVAKNFQITSMFKCNKPVEPYFSKACKLLDCSLFSTRPFKSFGEHPSWCEAHELAMNKYSRGLVCGSKRTGKSTYVRYQVNKLLAHGPVLVVDLDPGQSLFTVAGSVSATVVTAPLFGPSFTHLKKPELMLNIGMINTLDNTKLYASAVQSLITFCHNNRAFKQMPWIVNTMGMTNSVGLKFITLIITLLQPTYILQYESMEENLNFETLLTPTNVKELYEEYRNQKLFRNVTYPEDLDYFFVIAAGTDSPHMKKKTFSLSPKDERYLNFLAYFSQLVVRGESLLRITPYVVSLRDLCIATNVVVRREHVMQVLNGKLVALCQQSPDKVALFKLTDKPLRCVGHGLIRGIDWDKGLLYVITPVQSAELGGVDTVLYADWAPELVWHESQLPLGTPLPYRTSTADKQLMSTPRRRFTNPLQVLKMAGGVPN